MANISPVFDIVADVFIQTLCYCVFFLLSFASNPLIAVSADSGWTTPMPHQSVYVGYSFELHLVVAGSRLQKMVNW